MNVLAVDTSGKELTVALKTDNSYQEYIADLGMKHSESLLPTILDLCKKAEITSKEINRLVCTRGPGSFTGLRIGMACLKGIQTAIGCPLVSISTLEIMAFPFKDLDLPVVVALDARKKRFYLGVYKEGKALCPDLDGSEEDIAELLKAYNKVIVTGPAADLFYPKLKDLNLNLSIIKDSLPIRNIGQAMMILSEDRKPDHIGQGPVYIRKSDAEIMREERDNGKKEI